MAKLLIIFAGCSGLIAVALGAFGAHALKSKLPPNMLDAYNTGNAYQFYHTVALLLVGWLALQWPEVKSLQWSGIFLMLGIVFFSGSLYVLATTGIRWFGPITPLGGVCFMIGWALLVYGAFKAL